MRINNGVNEMPILQNIYLYVKTKPNKNYTIWGNKKNEATVLQSQQKKKKLHLRFQMFCLTS